MNSVDILKNGLWHNNPATQQLLGLCPLLAVSNTLENALFLGLATLFVLICTNSVISVCRSFISQELRIPLFMLLIASFVTCVQYGVQAYAYSMQQSLGIFLALITTNCVILGRAEAFAYKQPVPHALLDGFSQGLGFLIVLLLLGGVREIIGQGTLWNYAILPNYSGFLLILLPPGAFIALGFLLALKNWSSASFKKSDNRKIKNKESNRIFL